MPQGAKHASRRRGREAFRTGVAYRKRRSPKPEDAGPYPAACANSSEGRGSAIAKGKYQEWLTDDGRLCIKGWARDGLTDEQIAAKMGISPSTFYRWQTEFPEIQEALKAGKAPVNVELEDTAFDLARGRCKVEEVVTEIFYEGVDKDGNPIEKSRHVRKTIRQVPPNATMIIFLEKNRMPDKYREKREDVIQVSQADYSMLDDVEVKPDE